MIAVSTKTYINNTGNDNQDTLNKLDLISVEAMISYAAFQRQTTSDLIKKAVLDTFGVTNLTDIRHSQRDEVVRFITDIKVAVNAQ